MYLYVRKAIFKENTFAFPNFHVFVPLPSHFHSNNMNFWSTKAATFILHYKTESHSKMGTTMILLLLWSSKWKKKFYLCLGLPKIFSYKRRFLPKEACCEHLIFKGRYMYVWDWFFRFRVRLYGIQNQRYKY